MTTYEIAVLGRARPGIVAPTTGPTTGLPAGLGLSLEDSSMTLAGVRAVHARTTYP